MELPAPATYKEAKNGGKILLTSDGHEFSKNKDDGKKYSMSAARKYVMAGRSLQPSVRRLTRLSE